MSHRLDVQPVQSSSQLRHCLSPGQAGDHGDFDGETLVVVDEADAQRLVDAYPNVGWADAEPDTDDAQRRRMEVTNDGVSMADDDVPLSERSYDELRSMAAEADTDDIDGRSSKAEIVAHFEGDG